MLYEVITFSRPDRPRGHHAGFENKPVIYVPVEVGDKEDVGGDPFDFSQHKRVELGQRNFLEQDGVV